jgi:CheY-like chemotaxis protein
LSPLLLALNCAQADVDLVTSGSSMLSELRRKPFDLIILDRFMPEMNGDEVLRVGDNDPDLDLAERQRVIFYTSTPATFTSQSYSKFLIQDVWSKMTPMFEIHNKLERMTAQLTC